MEDRTLVALAAILAIVHVTGASAAEWPQWRGPEGNGIVRDSPALTTNWPATGPARVWTSKAKFAGSSNSAGGFGSVVVADGRVYCMVAPVRSETLITRQITAEALKPLGWSQNPMPADLLAAVEAARVSPERQALVPGTAVAAWIDAWVTQHVPQNQRRTFAPWIRDRLTLGSSAISTNILARLATVLNKKFDDQSALDAWLATNEIPKYVAKALDARLTKSAKICDQQFICMDAANGKTLWNTVVANHYPDGRIGHGTYPASSTPCVANGRLYALGMSGIALCVETATGKVVWRQKIPAVTHGSFLVTDGVAIVTGRGVHAFDAATGAPLWHNETVASAKGGNVTPSIWRHKDRSYLVVRGLHCLDPKTGARIWSAKGDRVAKGGSQTVSGDTAVVWDDEGVIAFALEPNGARQLWKVPCKSDLGASPTVYEGHVYCIGGGGGLCVQLADGKVCWREKLGTGTYASPVLADGKLFAQGMLKNESYGDGSLLVVAASPDALKILNTADLKQLKCTTPAFVDGRMYCRHNGYVACYDLRAPAAPKSGKEKIAQGP